MKPVKPLLFALLLCITASASAQQIYSISPRTILGGIGEILTIKGSGFGAMRGNSYVSFFRDGNIYSDANEGNGFNYISWSNTEIKLQMPVAYSNKIKVLVNGVECISPDTLHVTASHLAQSWVESAKSSPLKALGLVPCEVIRTSLFSEMGISIRMLMKEMDLIISAGVIQK